jgi:hypothetical protein
MDFVTATRGARKVLNEQGFKDWDVYIEDNPKCLGTCRYEQKVIALQSNMIIEAKEFYDILPVVLHEVSHAKSPGDEHGKIFHTNLRKLIASYAFGIS